MSVVTVVAVTPNRLEILVRYLASGGDKGFEREELEAVLTPASLARQGQEEPGQETAGSSTQAVPVVLAEARSLGLVEDVPDQPESIRVPVDRRHLAGPSLREYLDLILTDVASAEIHHQDAVPYALAWFLAQDPGEPIPWDQNQRLRIASQSPGETEAFDLTIETRFSQFTYWVRYLGYGWRAPGPQGDVIVPDPTEALARHLTALFSGRHSLEARQLPAALAARTGVFEDGAARRAVEAALTPNLQRSSSTLSASTSLALTRLEQRGLLTLELQADAPTIDLAVWPTPRPISHVVWNGAA